MLKFLIICPMVFLEGFVDAIAGGGGLISLPAYLFAGLFNIAGNFLGAKLFETKGAKFVKPIMIVVIAIYIVKLITEIF